MYMSPSPLHSIGSSAGFYKRNRSKLLSGPRIRRDVRKVHEVAQHLMLCAKALWTRWCSCASNDIVVEMRFHGPRGS